MIPAAVAPGLSVQQTKIPRVLTVGSEAVEL